MTCTEALSAAAVAAATVGLCVACSTAPSASAEPAQPQPNTSCAEEFDGALTELPQAEPKGNAKSLLQCRQGNWQAYTDVYPSSDRWVSTDEKLILHGQGMRNPEFRAGTWTGTPQSEAAMCTAETVDVVAAGETGPATTTTADPGQPVEFTASTTLFNVTLGGYCLWQRST